LSLLSQGKCLECAALVGRAAGLEVFNEDAVLLLQEMVNAHEAVCKALMLLPCVIILSVGGNATLR
jgi:hypothetical protein